MSSEKPTVTFDYDYADPGATTDMFKATETIAELVKGFDKVTTYTALLNAIGIAICQFSDTETEAMEENRRFKRELDRCVQKNYQSVRAKK